MKTNISEKDRKSNHQARQVKEQFTGKNLTRFGGSGLIRRFLKRHGIKGELDRRLKVDGRRRSKYGPASMITNCLYGVFLGYSRPSQMEILVADKVFQKVACLSAFPVQSTISRFLNSLKVSVAKQIASFNFDLLMMFRGGFEESKSIVLDLDSYVTPVYGSQQPFGLGHNPKKKGRKSHHPLLCFVGESRDYLEGGRC